MAQSNEVAVRFFKDKESIDAFYNSDEKANPEYVAPTPPMGWNSYNSFGAAVTEQEVKANARYMAEHMKEYGWEYVVIDYTWYYPHPPNSIQNNPPQFRLDKDNAPVPWMPMDEFGRLLPDPRKFPSSKDGKGFAPLAEYVHSLGLKFGIHVMRGIPRQAVWADTPVKHTSKTATDIVDTTSVCPWLNLMWGVDMDKEGAQAYYNSLIELYSDWGVDYIKLDDIDLNEDYPYRAAETAAFREAINTVDEDIVLSLSLNMKYKNREHVQANGDLWRISKDFWDEWELLEKQFPLAAQWAHVSGPDSWPDADMLQLGWISLRGPHGEPRQSRFTPAEERTHMTLWSIFRSPLMMGGHMPRNSAYTESLLTNPEVIEVNQGSVASRQLSREDGHVVWVSEDKDSDAINIALFNLNEQQESVSVSLQELGIDGPVRVRDLWARQDLGTVEGEFARSIATHGSGLFRVYP